MNLTLVAPTGSGKTTRFVIPNLLGVHGSVVVTDPSGEIFERTSGHMKDRGYRIHVLQPADLSGSMRFNPLTYYRSSQQLRQIATILSQNAGDGARDSFWITSARNLLYWTLEALCQVEDSTVHNLANLRWILNHMGGVDERGIHHFMARYLKDERLFSEFLAFMAQDSRVLTSVLSSARACLELWSDPEICQLTATNNVELQALRKHPTVFYLIVPEHRIRYFSLILNLFYSACFAHCLEHSQGIPVTFLLDEFGNLGRINEFAGIITTLRKRRCSVALILQELSQLTAIYGQHDGRTIYSGGCANKLFYSGLDLETTRYVEGMLGHNTEYDTMFGGIDHHAHTVAVPLMRSDSVRMMRGTEGVLISGRRRPVRIKMPPYFAVPSLRRLAEKPPVRLEYDYTGEQVRYFNLKESYQLV